MPRVAIKKKDYMKKDMIEWIRQTMYALKISQERIGAILGLSQQCMSYRLRTGQFTYMELIEIFKTLQATDEEIIKFMKIGG